VRAPLVLLLGALAGLSSGCGQVASGDRPEVPAALSFSEEQLRDRIDAVIDFTEMRYMDTSQHAAWQILHGVVAYGRELRIYHEGELVRALDWLLQGGRLTGFQLRPTPHGLDVITEPGSRTGQGHEDQWLGYMVFANVQWDDTIVWEGRNYTIGDMVRQAMWDIHDGMEASWTLMALSAFPEQVPFDGSWKAADGQQWTLERIVAMEAAQDLRTSACGGSHRLSGLALTLNRYLAQVPPGTPLEGGWKAAEEKIQESIRTIRAYQQPDGSFSAEYFSRPVHTSDLVKRMSTTGHQLEFLTIALTDAQLREPWVTRAVIHLVELFEQTRDLPVECGGLYHSANALKIYRDRRFGMRQFGDPQPEHPAAVEHPRGEAPGEQPPGAVPLDVPSVAAP
jgi:hypothetical protein